MQTILGSGGAIGNVLAKELPSYTDQVRLVARHPKKVNNTDELFTADLTDKDAVNNAVKGSKVVYLVAGLTYNLKVWQQKWPVIMKNAISACKQHDARLVFFDNIYMYDENSLDNITEENPINPPSKKGKVRADLVNMLMNEVKAGKLTAMIVRAADFYGPEINSSMLQETVYKNFKKGKKANWLADANKIHSFTYVPDAAKATALLANTADAYNQVWHAPTDDAKITGIDLINMFAKEMDVKPRYSIIPKAMIKLIGLFNPIMREIPEMMYQNDRDYFFNSEKFRKRFPDFRITSYAEGIKEVVKTGK